MTLLREVKGDAEKLEGDDEATVNVGSKKVTIKVQDEKSEQSQPKRQLLCE